MEERNSAALRSSCAFKPLRVPAEGFTPKACPPSAAGAALGSHLAADRTIDGSCSLRLPGLTPSSPGAPTTRTRQPPAAAEASTPAPSGEESFSPTAGSLHTVPHTCHGRPVLRSTGPCRTSRKKGNRTPFAYFAFAQHDSLP